MKNTSLRMLCRKLTSDRFDANIARGTCFSVAGLVLVLSFWKITQLDLSEAQLYFGLLLTLCMPL